LAHRGVARTLANPVSEFVELRELEAELHDPKDQENQKRCEQSELDKLCPAVSFAKF
jgi:hypothetical protein